MITLFLGIDFFVQRKKKTARVPQGLQRPSSPLRAPAGIFFAPSHTWLSLFPSGNVRIGADDFVLRMMENPKIVFLKNPGMLAKKGEPLFQLREGSHTLTVRSPIDGEILAVNDDVQKHPAMLKEMLFSGGWAYTVKPQRTSELTHLLLGEASRAWIQNDLGRLRDFIAESHHSGSPVPVLLQDGGVPVDGALKNFSAELCEQFEQQFLLVH
jgi:glycine cleavage system H protein